MVRTVGTRIDLDSQDTGLPPSDDLGGRDVFGGDVVCDEVARRSSSFRTSGTPLTPIAPSSIRISRARPEVLAKATMVLNAPARD
jgi:hypothetical protein